MRKPKYINKVEDVENLTSLEKEQLGGIEEKYSFRSNDYYMSLIDWSDPDDPIRRITLPQEGELDDWGELDTSDEMEFTVVPGLQHKYTGTALLLVNNVCGSYCRFCFRKRLFMDENDEVVRDISEGISYIREHREITNVLLTGGDPLILSTGKLEGIINQLREIDHVKIIRIGTKMPAFNPFRIINDPSLMEMLARSSGGEKKIYMMMHFNHPREITPEAIQAVNLIQSADVITANQTPLLRGINDDPEVLAELFNKLSFIGVPPYYIFQVRPTKGNRIYCVPIEETVKIFEEAQSKCSGLAKRAKLVMSHSTGKVEILGRSNGHTFFRYHRSPNPENSSGLIAFKRNPQAYWLDDYEESMEYAIDDSGAGILENSN